MYLQEQVPNWQLKNLQFFFNQTKFTMSQKTVLETFYINVDCHYLTCKIQYAVIWGNMYCGEMSTLKNVQLCSDKDLLVTFNKHL